VLRVVVDNNTIASATIKGTGNPAKILDAWREGKIEIIISPSIIKEMRRILFYERVRKYSFMTESEIEELIKSLEESGIMTPAQLKLEVVKADPTDDKWLVAAIEGKADYIVSGDPHLKSLGSYQRIRILSPTEFVRVLKI
jgi:putative PIN family toxin of toxin-antitoxin system